MFAKFGAGLESGGCGVGGGLKVVGNELVDESGLIHCLCFFCEEGCLLNLLMGLRCLLETVGWVVGCDFWWSMSCIDC